MKMAFHQRLPYTIPAAGVIANLLSGQGVEYIGRASMLDLFATADVAGDTFGLTQTLGGDVRTIVPAGSSIGLASAAGAGPKLDEDMWLNGVAIPAGAHLILAIVGTAAHTGRFAINVSP